MSETAEPRTLRWRRLPEETRSALAGRLAGLYGHATDEEAFDSLAEDKQQALFVFVRRLKSLGLWPQVGRVSNVYGVGGVGLEFVAAEDFSETLRADARFTARFATHGDCAEGFFETRRSRAALHFLRMKADARHWSAHFDLHGPLADPASALRHLLHEKIRGRTPDWRAVRAALGYDAEGRDDDTADRNLT